MISEQTLQRAVARGMLSTEQVAALRALEGEAVPTAAAPVLWPEDDEKLRFITGFGDIFVTIGLGLFLAALGYFSSEALGLFGMAAVLAIACWALAEFFTRRRRMALPSIVLLVIFAAMVFLSVYGGIAAVLGDRLDAGLDMSDWLPGFSAPFAFAGAGLATALASLAHYRRFQVPITLAAGALALIGFVFGGLYLIMPKLMESHFALFTLLCGFGVFALAMRFDMSDPQRLTRRTDIAFWLHMLAAPMIVQPLVHGFVLDSYEAQTASAWGILAIFVLLGLVALLVDRRAVLVSGLAYAGIAFGTLLSSSTFGGSALGNNVAPLTMLMLGAFVLALSAGWHPLRRALLCLLPVGLASRLPNPVSTDPLSANTSVASPS